MQINKGEHMQQYRIEMGIIDHFVVYVEADDEEHASEIANSIDVMDWQLLNSETKYFDIYEEN